MTIALLIVGTIVISCKQRMIFTGMKPFLVIATHPNQASWFCSAGEKIHLKLPGCMMSW